MSESPLFERGPRPPPGLSAFAVFLIAMPAWVLLRGTPADPDAYWQIPLGVGVAILVLCAILLPTTFVSVEVRKEGLFVRGRLAVPAEDIGWVDLLSGWDMAGVYWTYRDLKVPWRQNLYGGGYGLGKAVAVEHLGVGARSTVWLLPGPRTEELAAALESVRVGEDAAPGTDDLMRRPTRWKVRKR